MFHDGRVIRRGTGFTLGTVRLVRRAGGGDPEEGTLFSVDALGGLVWGVVEGCEGGGRGASLLEDAECCLLVSRLVADGDTVEVLVVAVLDVAAARAEGQLEEDEGEHSDDRDFEGESEAEDGPRSLGCVDLGSRAVAVVHMRGSSVFVDVVEEREPAVDLGDHEALGEFDVGFVDVLDLVEVTVGLTGGAGAHVDNLRVVRPAETRFSAKRVERRGATGETETGLGADV